MNLKFHYLFILYKYISARFAFLLLIWLSSYFFIIVYWSISAYWFILWYEDFTINAIELHGFLAVYLCLYILSKKGDALAESLVSSMEKGEKFLLDNDISALYVDPKYRVLLNDKQINKDKKACIYTGRKNKNI